MALLSAMWVTLNKAINYKYLQESEVLVVRLDYFL